jgi:hypothetical protein
MIGLGASEPHRHVQRVKTAEEIVFGVLCLVVAFLQSNHIRFGVLTSYGADIACPAYLYLISRRRGKSPFTFLRPATPGMAAGCVFALSVAWEIGQKVRLVPGVYDPLDIVAYGVGVAVPFLIERWLSDPSLSRR